MKRFLSLVAALVVLFSTTAVADADFRSYPHWHYRNSYITSQDSLGQWRVTSYYYIKLNGSSPGYVPTVAKTAPMECDVPYAIAIDVKVTHCDLDKLTYYWPYRWRVTARWTVCFWIVCSSHGQNLTFKATGEITERSSW